MNWTTYEDLHKQLTRLWDKGVLPNAIIAENTLFPLTFPLRTPTAPDITHRLQAVRKWVETLKVMSNVTLIWQTVNNRVQGPQTLPQTAVIETVENALAILKKQNSFGQIKSLYSLTVQDAPFLLPWFSQNVLAVYRHAEEWERILKLSVWMKENPNPGIYIRQVDLPGVHTKFIEQNKNILSQIFQEILPPEAVNATYSGVNQFEARYGFRTKPLRIRFRILDASLSPFSSSDYPDITLDAESFANLSFTECRVFIVENESCFLSFPYFKNALVIFGAGYCWEALKPAVWLQKCDIYYWGDIDTHGFRILDHLRAILPHTCSFLMGEETFEAYRSFWAIEPSPVMHPLTRLTLSELRIFTLLQNSYFGKKLRLEQERIYMSELYEFLDQFSPESLLRIGT